MRLLHGSFHKKFTIQILPLNYNAKMMIRSFLGLNFGEKKLPNRIRELLIFVLAYCLRKDGSF